MMQPLLDVRCQLHLSSTPTCKKMLAKSSQLSPNIFSSQANKWRRYFQASPPNYQSKEYIPSTIKRRFLAKSYLRLNLSHKVPLYPCIWPKEHFGLIAHNPHQILIKPYTYCQPIPFTNAHHLLPPNRSWPPTFLNTTPFQPHTLLLKPYTTNYHALVTTFQHHYLTTPDGK